MSFFVTLAKFLSRFATGLRDREFRTLLLLLVGLIASGVIFYGSHEVGGIVDSNYFCIMTLSTVGYGDLHPTTPISRIFTVIYLIIGGGVFVGFITKVADQRQPIHLQRHRDKDSS